MTICRPKKLDHKIRHLTRMIKNAHNEANAFRAEATYHQAIVDNIKTHFPEIEIGGIDNL
jgi:hypothetical protein